MLFSDYLSFLVVLVQFATLLEAAVNVADSIANEPAGSGNWGSYLHEWMVTS